MKILYVRVPEDLHKALTTIAAREERTITDVVRTYLRRAVRKDLGSDSTT